MEIREMPPYLGLNLKEFAVWYGIPYRTLQGWIAGERKCPPYVRELLERAVLEDKERKDENEWS